MFAMCGRAVSNLSCQICRCIYIVDIDERQERRSKTLKNNVNERRGNGDMLFTQGGRGDQAGHGDVSYKAIQCVGWEELHF
jgi:hypothetical protein